MGAADGTAEDPARRPNGKPGGVSRIVIDEVVSPMFDGQQYAAVGQYEMVEGRVFGELDPRDPLNAIIQDIELAPTNQHGMVAYEATFALLKPVDMTRASGLMWHFVPNRGSGTRALLELESLDAAFSQRGRERGDIWLSSGWQGENIGDTTHERGREWVRVPVAQNPDGSAITGRIMARVISPAPAASVPVSSLSNPVPYPPATLDTAQATLTIIESETPQGTGRVAREVPGDEWAWARCTDDEPFPGTPDPHEICVDGGVEPDKVYQVVYPVQDPPVLGIGFAAFRDVASFFKHQAKDDDGAPNPVAGHVDWIVARGDSQSGNMLRQFLHLGFNQDTSGRQVHDGHWIRIASRRVALNHRFAVPDGILRLYEPGIEGPQWWTPWPDDTRALPATSILDRCRETGTCPKIIETYGSAELWNLKLSLEWVGTDARADIPLPPEVRRYYVPGVSHGGGSGSFDLTPEPPPAGINDGRPVLLPANPISLTETYNAIEAHLRRWIMDDVAPPPSMWPTLDDGVLVQPTKEAMGFPSIPGLPEHAPSGLMNEILDYDFGPEFNHVDGSGVMTVVPPTVKQVIPSLAPRVDGDGNEIGGVPVVLHDAPLGTYVGWNVGAGGFGAGRGCDLFGGVIPFAKTKAEREATGDPRPSLEERYGSHAGWMQKVKQAAANAVEQGFLLPEDAESLIERAQQAANGWPA